MEIFKDRDLSPFLIKLGIVLVMVLILTLPSIINLTTRATVTTIITDKAIKRYDDSDVYLIYTDVGTFKNTDELLFGKFNSSDIYGQIIIGNKYELTTVGLRIPILSEYPNIIEIKPVN